MQDCLGIHGFGMIPLISLVASSVLFYDHKFLIKTQGGHYTCITSNKDIPEHSVVDL